MKVTKSNHDSVITADVAKKLGPELKEAHDFYKEFSSLADEDKDIQEAVDLYLENVSEWAKNNLSEDKKEEKPKAKAKKKAVATAPKAKKATERKTDKKSATPKKKSSPKKSTSTAKKKTSTAKKAAAVKKEDTAKRVNKISPEVTLAKRAKNLHDKVVSKRQVAALVKSLQRSILKKEIRKNSPHADFIMDLQRLSVNFHNGMKKDSEKFNLPESLLKKAVDLADDERVRDSVRLVNRYIGLINTDKIEAMKRLLDAIEKALDKGSIKKEDDYYAVINNITKKLKTHTSSHTVLDATQTELAGLQDVLKKYGIMPATPGTKKPVRKKATSSRKPAKKAVGKKRTSKKK